MKFKMMTVFAALFARGMTAAVSGEDLKACCGSVSALSACVKSYDDFQRAGKGHYINVKDGLLDQSNTNTLSLAYPDGLETVTVWKAQDEGDHYCNGVCLVKYNGRLYCQWQSSQTDEDAPDTHIRYAVSDNGGRSWSEARELPAEISGGYCSSGGWYAAEDRLIAYINFWPDDISPRGGFTYYVSSEDGENWSAPQPVTMSDGTPLNAIFEQDPHILPGGRIVNAAHFQKGLMVSPIYTDDKSGVSGWKRADFTPTDKGDTSREMEPSIFERADGSLVMIFRDQDSTYTKRAALSWDRGASWSEVFPTKTPDARTKQSAGNLSDGTAFMVGSPVDNKLRSPLAVLLSKDGKTFDKAYLLRSNESDPEVVYDGKAKRKGFHYAKSYVSDGSLYVGYATNKEAVEIAIIPETSLK